MADNPAPDSKASLGDQAAQIGSKFAEDTMHTVRGILNGATFGGWNVYAGIVNKAASSTINSVAEGLGKKPMQELSLTQHVQLENSRSANSVAYTAGEITGAVVVGIGGMARLSSIQEIQQSFASVPKLIDVFLTKTEREVLEAGKHAMHSMSHAADEAIKLTGQIHDRAYQGLKLAAAGLASFATHSAISATKDEPLTPPPAPPQKPDKERER